MSTLGGYTPDQFIAHRGYRKCYPENTLTAITAALNAGAVNIEIDVQFSQDGFPVLYHDDNLNRVSGIDQSIFELPLKELITLSAYEPDRFGDTFRNVPISSMEECAELISVKNHAHYYIELKEESLRYFSIDYCLEALSAVLMPSMQNITLISFDTDAIRRAKTHYGFRTTGMIIRDWAMRNQHIQACLADIAYVNIDVISDNDRINAGCPLMVYEIADPVLAKSALDRGANKVETFEIGELIKVLCKNNTKLS